MGKILRIGVDDVVNYNFQGTSTYDEAEPAQLPTAWSDSTAMDQGFDQANPLTVESMGVLVTFERFPDTFLGAMVKIEPEYDSDAGEIPAFEMWTHDSVADEWTKRRRIVLSNLFVGVPSGTRKVVDFTFFPFLRNVDMVWLTMDPGATGSPTMNFVAIQMFGQCEGSLRNDSGGGGGDPCSDPTDPFYTGFDDNGDPCPGTGPSPPTEEPPSLDLCNEASVQQYRDYISTIPGFLAIFDAWFEANATNISLFCAGIESSPPTPPTPPGDPPALPPLDLCDQTSIDAFRAALSGNATALANFEAFLTEQEDSGFFDLVCPPAEPDEQYVDPETLEFDDEPDSDNNTPFGAGPGGQPQFPRPDDRDGFGNGSPAQFGVQVDRYIFAFFDQTALDEFIHPVNFPNETQEVQDAWNDPNSQSVIFGNGVRPPPGNGDALDRIRFRFHGLATGDLVKIEIREGGILAQSPPRTFTFWPASLRSASVTSSFIVHWLVERTTRLGGVAGTTVEQGGDPSATVAQSQGVVLSGSGLPMITAITAFDPNVSTNPIPPTTPTESDESSHVIGGPQNIVIKKHLAANDLAVPPFTRHTGTARLAFLFKLSMITKFPPGNQNAASVYVTYDYDIDSSVL